MIDIPEPILISAIGVIGSTLVAIIAGWWGFRQNKKKVDVEISQNIHKAEESLREFLTTQLKEMDVKLEDCENHRTKDRIERLKDQQSLADVQKKNIDLDLKVHRMIALLKQNGINYVE